MAEKEEVEEVVEEADDAPREESHSATAAVPAAVTAMGLDEFVAEEDPNPHPVRPGASTSSGDSETPPATADANGGENRLF